MPLPRPLAALLLCLVIATAAGCARPGPEAVDAGPTGFYVDASLGFAIEHPQNWQHTREQQLPGPGTTVLWQPKAAGRGARLAVTSLLPTQAVGGFDRLLEIFRDRHPDLGVTAREPLTIAGAAAQKIRAHTSAQVFELVMITTQTRAFILAFSAPPDQFKGDQDVFDRILESFRPLP